MTGDLFINGKDALETWGARMGNGFLDAIDGFNEMKDYIENESRLEHGKRVITDNAKVDSRESLSSSPLKAVRKVITEARRKPFRQSWRKEQ